MRLYLIRHGETPFNKAQRIQYDEIPLSDMGIAQAGRLGRHMADVPLDRIISSDLRRAAMTACILAAHTGTPLTWDHAFREREVGELAGKPYEEAMPFFDDADYVPPGGEGVRVFIERVIGAFEALLEEEGSGERHIAVVSHGMVCRAFMETCLGRSREEDAALIWPNTSVTIADYDGRAEDGRAEDGGWKLVTRADATHLEGLDPSPAHSTGA